MMHSKKITDYSRHAVRTWLRGGLLAAATFAFIGAAQAEQIQIVAIGASNTSGLHVSTSERWSNRLESMLRAKGYDATVSNMGVVGDTSAGILSRVASIPAGTKVVVFDVGAGNDKDTGAGGATAANRARIEQAIRAKGAKPVFLGYGSIVGRENSNPSAWRANDPHHHLTPQSHAKVAAAALSRVTAVIGKK
jgi:lysophospholipase L1-like esterase